MQGGFLVFGFRTLAANDLFRQFPRLMRKLSSEETRAINELVNKRVRRDYASLLHDISLLELSRDKAELKLNETLESAKKEAERDKSLVREYKRGFGSVSQLLSTKEHRFEGKLEQAETLLKETEQNRKQTEVEKNGLLAECRDKDKIIENLSQEMARLRTQVKQVEDYKEIVEKNESMRREALRLKFDLDVQKRENTKLLKDIDRLKSGLPVGLAFVGLDKDAVSKAAIDNDTRRIRRSRSTSLLRQRDTAWIPRSISNVRYEVRDPSPNSRPFKHNQTYPTLDKQAYLDIQAAPTAEEQRLTETNFQVNKYGDRQPVGYHHPNSASLLRRRQQPTTQQDIRPPFPMAVAQIPPFRGAHHRPTCLPDCRAKKDLEDCRAHLARTCEQNAYMSYTLANLRDTRSGDINGRGINLNVQLKQVGLDNMYSYRQRVSMNPAKPSAPPPAAAVYTAPTLDDIYPGPAPASTDMLQGYNAGRRLRKFDQARYVYRK
ncbi:hypothetical protein ElyMa_002985700 [Elysia marginata]|uniref:Uncharacterized protein n=1 Tax=Elysia marginata TaxID=1093978 RepID=A0AAV4IFI6_9GAST|nr:hypothetical protein ElyMa_002985700 [Elysia marginata]